MTPERKKLLLKRLLILPPVLLGIAAVAIMVRGKDAPERADLGEETRRVRVMEVSPLTVVPRVRGFGVVRPGKVWEAVAEVGGKIIYIHPDLKSGALLAQDTELLVVDPTDYRLEVANLKAQLAALDARETNARASLRIEKRALALSARDLERRKELHARGAVSEAAVDAEERNLLAREQAAQTHESILNLLPAERDQLEARLAEAERNLARTRIVLPFDARIAEVSVEMDQVAKVGQTMLAADSIAVAEVTAQVQIDKMLNLLPADMAAAVDPVTAMPRIGEVLGVTPVVRLRSGALTAEWRGRVVRVSDRIDPQTRTVGIVVAVDDPYAGAGANADMGAGQHGARPPLAKNMYVEVELRGRPQPGRLAVPRAALHDGRVYLVGENGRLAVRGVTVAYVQGDMAVIGAGLQAGDRVVVSDLVPAIEGMLLDPEPDPRAADMLSREAGAAAETP